MKKFIVVGVVLLFAANAFAANLLVYDAGDGRIQTAMTQLGLAYDLRNAAAPVTAADLNTHTALIVGWNAGGDMSGLSGSVLESRIGGNIFLTGQDIDWHVVHGLDTGAGGDAVDAAATTLLTQAIGYATSAPGTGLVALGDLSTAFTYLPASWGISATGGLVKEDVSSITAAGVASGIYAGLTAADLSNWLNSYHAVFDSYGAEFAAFQLGDNDSEVVAIGGAVVPLPGALMLGLVGTAVVGVVRRFKRS